MGSIPISRPEPRQRLDFRKPVLPLASALLAIVAAVVAVYFLTQSDEPPYVIAGNVDTSRWESRYGTPITTSTS